MTMQLRSIFLYILSFLLLWEWLRPLPLITSITSLTPLVWFCAVTFFISVLAIPIFLSFPLKLLIVGYVEYVLFYQSKGPFFQSEWARLLIHDLTSSFQLMLKGQFSSVNDPFRTFLFLILLWLITYLLNYWIIYAKRIFLFLLLTFVFVGIVDAFTAYHAGRAFIRIVLIGFSLMGFLYYFRLHDELGLPVSWRSFFRYAFWPLMIVILFSVSLAYMLPKFEPRWSDPTAALTDKLEGTKKSGIGFHDDQLGGPFEFDHSPLFTITTDRPAYLRVETKSTYTGKGWKNEGQSYKSLNGGKIPLGLYPTRESNKTLVTISDVKEAKQFYVVYPGEIGDLKAKDKASVRMEEYSQRLEWVNKKGRTVARDYQFYYYYPSYTIDDLRGSQTTPTSALEPYLQLPATLPNRVKDLAASITAPYTTNYDKAKAIERYLKTADYSYETQEVATPKLDEDYVDQFLFDTKKGYCDNFSTAMAVMLRSTGIPARWVKGYQINGHWLPNDKKTQTIEVTNADAHAWVEVYFDGVGWVPFEPTKGISQPVEMKESSMPPQAPPQQPTENVKPMPQPMPPQEAPQVKQKEQKETKNAKGKETINVKWIGLAIFIVLFIALVLLCKRIIKRWLLKVVIIDAKTMKKAYARLQFVLRWYCQIKKENVETYREFAARFDQTFHSSTFSTFTMLYEQVIYAKEDQEIDGAKAQELYENLVNTIFP